MKRSNIFLALLISGLSGNAQVQKSTPLPSVDLKTLEGVSINSSEIVNDGKPIIILFWASWCKPCMQELIAINDVYDEWQEETGAVIYVISIDDSRTSAKVPAIVNGRGWSYTVLLDINQDFKRSMGVNNPPHTFILDKDRNIAWQHSGYLSGDEEEYIDVVRKLLSGDLIE